MRKQIRPIPPALKHGIYSSAIGLLPTEDPAEFEKFKQEIFDDYKPVGRSEVIIVNEIACLAWRLEHLATYGLATTAQSDLFQIATMAVSTPSHRLRRTRDPKRRRTRGLAQKRGERGPNQIGPSHQVGRDWRRRNHRVLGKRTRHQRKSACNDRET